MEFSAARGNYWLAGNIFPNESAVAIAFDFLALFSDKHLSDISCPPDNLLLDLFQDNWSLPETCSGIYYLLHPLLESPESCYSVDYLRVAMLKAGLIRIPYP